MKKRVKFINDFNDINDTGVLVVVGKEKFILPHYTDSKGMTRYGFGEILSKSQQKTFSYRGKVGINAREDEIEYWKKNILKFKK